MKRRATAALAAGEMVAGLVPGGNEGVRPRKVRRAKTVKARIGELSRREAVGALSVANASELQYLRLLAHLQRGRLARRMMRARLKLRKRGARAGAAS